ncbi:MAG: glycosyl hydrolase family 18 protein [Chloroflexota bacterium]
MRRLFPSLCLLAVLFASCAAPATPSVPTETATSLPATATMTPAPPPFRIIAYATDSIIENLIPYDKLTHINYSFLTPKDDGTFNSIVNGWKLKKIVENGHKHNVRVLISVGGWGWDAQFETVAASPELRSAFVKNLKVFVDEYQLDGADIDWEYPDAGQSSQNFLALITELRTAMPAKLLTTAVVSYGENSTGISPEAIALLDFVNVMTYDGPDHGTMKQFEQGLAFWTARGLPKEKIVMGVPFYGDPNLPYFKIVAEDPTAAQTDTFNYFGKTYQYNGIPTIQAKTKLAMDQASGIMFWTLDFDAQGELSLVNAIYQTAHQ